MDFRNGAVLDDEALGDRYGVGFPKGVEVQIKIKEWLVQSLDLRKGQW